MADVHEEEAVDYEGSTREELTMLYDGLWGSATDTPPKCDTSKSSYLSAEDLKAINPLDSSTPSREVEGNSIFSSPKCKSFPAQHFLFFCGNKFCVCLFSGDYDRVFFSYFSHSHQ